MEKIRALLVDDNKHFLESIEHYITSFPGLNILCVGKALSGEEAVTKSKQLKPDLILMDIAMPGKGGLESTRLIKQDKGRPPIVVMLTIYENEEYRKAAQEAGADGFLPKSRFTQNLIPIVKTFFPGLLNLAVGESKLEHDEAARVVNNG